MAKINKYFFNSLLTIIIGCSHRDHFGSPIGLPVPVPHCCQVNLICVQVTYVVKLILQVPDTGTCTCLYFQNRERGELS